MIYLVTFLVLLCLIGIRETHRRLSAIEKQLNGDSEQPAAEPVSGSIADN